MARFRKIAGGADYDDRKERRRSRRRERENTVSYREKIDKYKRKNLYRALLVAVLLAVLAIIIYAQYNNHVYTGYETISSMERSISEAATDVRLGSSILTYSQDGAHCTDAKGNVLWNQTYQIQDLLYDINGSTVAFANYNGREIYVLNETVQLGAFSTTMPIRNVAVSDAGTVTAILFDTDVTWINQYSADGKNTFSGQAHMSNSGYPATVALSPSGTLLAVGYIYVDAGTLKTSVAFYNFGPVGDNYGDYLVSGFDYSDVLIPEIGFLDDKTAYAVGDDRLVFYRGGEAPTEDSVYFHDGEVRSVFSGSGYIGLVFLSNQSDSRYRLDVYNSSGRKEGSYFFDLDYTDIVFEKNDFVLYNESECLILTYDGREKFAGTFTKAVHVLVPTDRAYRYLLVTDTSIDTIQLN